MADGSDTLKKICRGLAPNERSISISRSLVVRSPASVLMVTGKQHQEDHHQHLRPDADAEPEDEQRRERDGRRGVEPGNPRLQRPLRGGAAGHGEAEHDADHAGDDVAERELDRADRHVLLHLARSASARQIACDDLRGRGEEQRIGDHEAADQLPEQKPAEHRERAGEIAQPRALRSAAWRPVAARPAAPPAPSTPLIVLVRSAASRPAGRGARCRVEPSTSPRSLQRLEQRAQLRPRDLAGRLEEFVLVQEVVGLLDVVLLELARLHHHLDRLVAVLRVVEPGDALVVDGEHLLEPAPCCVVAQARLTTVPANGRSLT